MPCTSWSKFEDSIWQANAASSWIVKELRVGFGLPSLLRDSFSTKCEGPGVSTPKSQILITILASSSLCSWVLKAERSEKGCAWAPSVLTPWPCSWQGQGACCLSVPLCFALSLSALLLWMKGWGFLFFLLKANLFLKLLAKWCNLEGTDWRWQLLDWPS